MAILTWKEILNRILEGLISLPDLDKNDRDELQKLKRKLKSDKHLSLKDIMKYVQQNERLKKILQEDQKKLSKIKDRIRQLDESFEELSDEMKTKPKHQNADLFPIFIDDFDIECLDPANYNLRLGNEVYVTTERLPTKLTRLRDTIVIKPGEFGILVTHEYIYIPPDAMGFISLRFSYKQKGLVNISGFHVDPGFRGKLIFAVYNTGPREVALRHREAIFMIMLEELKDTVEPYRRKFAGLEHIPTDIVTTLGGPSVSVLDLDKRIRSLETQIRIIEGLAIGIILLMLAALIRIILGG